MELIFQTHFNLASDPSLEWKLPWLLCLMLLELDRESISPLILLDLLMTFDVNQYVIFLNACPGIAQTGLLWFCPFV